MEAMLCLSELLSDLLSLEGIILCRLPIKAGVGKRNSPLSPPPHGAAHLPLIN